MEKILWIIRYSDGSLGCKYGTREEAEQVALERARNTGITYHLI